MCPQGCLKWRRVGMGRLGDTLCGSRARRRGSDGVAGRRGGAQILPGFALPCFVITDSNKHKFKSRHLDQNCADKRATSAFCPFAPGSREHRVKASIGGAPVGFGPGDFDRVVT